jgi:putative phosphoesterase
MLVGLMSDTHDAIPLVQAAVRELNRRKVALVLHAGDFVAPFVIRELQKLDAPFLGVFGNNDGDHELLKKRVAEKKDCVIRDTFATTSLDGATMAVLHGNEGELLDALVRGEIFDLVLHGHTHQKEIIRRGKTLLVNPGEVCGYLTGDPTMAVFDTETREAELVDL